MQLVFELGKAALRGGFFALSFDCMGPASIPGKIARDKLRQAGRGTAKLKPVD
jgi:hypothetical protein